MEKTNLDGWSNVNTSLGIKGKDKRLSGRAIFNYIVDETECLALYKNSGIGSLVATKIPSVMTMKDVTIEGDTENDLLDKLKKLDYLKKFRIALSDAQALGGSLILIGALDIPTRQGKLDKPLKPESVADILWLKNFDQTEISYQGHDVVTDMTSPFYGKPEYFYLSSKDGLFLNKKVHISRCLLFYGEPATSYFGNPYSFWGFSVYQRTYSDIRKIETAYDNVEVIIDEFSTWKYEVANLKDLMSAGKEDQIKKRIETINYSKSVINAIIHGSDESVTSESKSVGGLDSLIELFQQLLSGVVEVPVSLLFGRGATGMNATGEGDRINFYDKIASEQRFKMEEPLNYLLTLLNTFMNVIDDPKVTFKPIKQMTEKELAEIRKLNSETDSNYIDTGVLYPEEVANSRFAGENYSNDITIEEREITNMTMEQEEDEESEKTT